MSLQTGSKLGHYDILAPLGAGGMGEVYRAKDEALGREVAIKVLPDEVSREPERLLRFEREAKLLAALNHPAIATLHGLEKFHGTPFLVMELVEGETLSERIAAGPLPLGEAVSLFRQLAEALEAAHEKGIVHRDLKPANIKITPEGNVKVLDFGLAKALAGGDVETVDASHSPTLTRGTALGAILGTASYMSPEQARGRTIDKRTDIWAFGCVLYEALGGRRAFEGETVTDILARVVEREPDFDALPTTTPARIRELVRRCLEKDRKHRLRDIGEAWVLLSGVSREGTSAKPPAKTRRPYPAVLFVAVAAALLGFVARAMLESSRGGEGILKAARYVLPLSHPVSDVGDLCFALSPRGDAIVYPGSSENGESRLYFRSLVDEEDHELPGTNGARNPFFSPDGEWIGFYAQGSLQKISVRGGSPTPICKTPYPWGASWGPNSDIVFVSARNELSWVPAAGGEPKPLARSELGAYRWPTHLPDGKTVLVEHGRGIMAISLPDGDRKELDVGMEARVPRYSPTGHLIFASNNSLFAVSFDLKTLTTSGDPVPVIEGVRQIIGIANFSLGSNGTLYFVSGKDTATSDRSLVWVDRKGNEAPLSTDRRAFFMPRLSPDGNSVAVAVREGTRFDVWIYDLATGASRRLTSEGRSYNPVWSSKGDRIAYAFVPEEGKQELRLMRADGSGTPEVLVTAAEGGINPEVWSRDGRFLLYTEYREKTDYDVLVLEPDRKAEPKILVASEAYDSESAFSPDGQRIAFTSERTGLAEIYTQPFPGPGVPRQVSQGGGGDPVWLENGELVFRQRNILMVTRAQIRPTLSIGQPFPLLSPGFELYAGGFRNYDAAPDGSRFLVARGEDVADPKELTVIVNFRDELERLVPHR